MYLDMTLPPQFVVFHYFIQYFIQSFGSIPYYLGIVGSLGAFCVYALSKSIKSKEWEQTVMVVIFACILVGGLIGLGVDVSNGHAFDPMQY